MNASEYLRVKFQSDRRLALYFQHGAVSYTSAAKGLLSDMYSGAERVSWYSSCLIPKYHDVCKELFSEDKRLLMSVRAVYRHKDVIAFMIYLYFEKMISKKQEKKSDEMGSDKTKAQNFVTKTTGLLVKKPVGKATKYALAQSLSTTLAASGMASHIIIERLSKSVPYVTFTLQSLGMVQHCALAARRLKALDPEYYWILYSLELEMLYYFIEPILGRIIKDVITQVYSDFDDLYLALERGSDV